MKNVNASISQFMIQSTIATKHIQSSSSYHKQHNTQEQYSYDKIYCSQCEQNLQKIAQFRKNQIQLQFQLIKLNQKIQKIQKDNQFLIKKIQQKQQDQIVNIQTHDMQSVQNVIDDLQAQLFQCKFINQLLILNKYNYNQPLAQKYQKIMIQNLRLHQQIIIKDKIIKQKQFYPIYHYNNRIKFLRDSVIYMHNLATKQCKQIKINFNSIKQDNQLLLKNKREILTEEVKKIMKQNKSLQLVKLQKQKMKQRKQNKSFILDKKSQKIQISKILKLEEQKNKQKVNKPRYSNIRKNNQRLSKQKRCYKENCSSNY